MRCVTGVVDESCDDPNRRREIFTGINRAESNFSFVCCDWENQTMVGCWEIYHATHAQLAQPKNRATSGGRKL